MENENTQTNDQSQESEQGLSRSARRASNKDQSNEIQRRDDIEQLGNIYRQWVDRDDIAQAIRNGDSSQRFQDSIMNKITVRSGGHTNTSIPMSELGGYSGSQGREWDGMNSRYDFFKAIQTITDPAASMRSGGGGREREISEELSRIYGRKPGAGGFFIPDGALYKRALDVGSSHASGAGALSPDVLHVDLFAEGLRANTIVGALGARILSGEKGDVLIPRQSVTTTLGWAAESGVGTESTPDYNQLRLTPHRVTTFVDISIQSTIQASMDMQGIVLTDLLKGQSVEYDRIALSGSGSGNEPRGIINTSGVGAVAGGTNGALISYGALVDMEAAVANANAIFGASGFALNPKTRAWLKKTPKIAGSVTELAWNDEALDANGIGVVCGHLAGVSNNLRSNLTKGTAAGICSELIFCADWSELILARFGGNEVLVDPYTLASSGQIRVSLNAFVDVGVRRAASFAVMADALTA